MFFSDSSLNYLHILVATAATVLLIATPPSTQGNPITKRQFKKVVKLLEESLAKEIPSDDADKYSDVLFQEKYDKKNLTYYHGGNKKYPVFISNGLGSIGGNLHVLVRGEDYINHKDRNNFVVLRKYAAMAGGYTLHQAHIVHMHKLLKKGAKVLWNDGRVEQQKNVKPLLEQMGNAEVQARATRAQRPLCDWIGYSLYCNTAENVPPARERQIKAPLDEEDDEPVKLPGIVSEENKAPEGGEKPLAAKLKRFTDVGLIALKEPNGKKGKIGNELIELKIGTKKPLSTTTTTTTKTTTPTTTTPSPTTKPPTKRVSRLIIRTTLPPGTTTLKPKKRLKMVHNEMEKQSESEEGSSSRKESLSSPAQPTKRPKIVFNDVEKPSESEETNRVPHKEPVTPSSKQTEKPKIVMNEIKNTSGTVEATEPKKEVPEIKGDKEVKEETGTKVVGKEKEAERLSKKKHKKKHHIKRKMGRSDEEV